jgi:hypothetical protein
VSEGREALEVVRIAVHGHEKRHAGIHDAVGFQTTAHLVDNARRMSRMLQYLIDDDAIEELVVKRETRAIAGNGRISLQRDVGEK